MILSVDEVLRQLAQSHPALQFLLIAISTAFTEEVAVVGVIGLARAGEISWILALLAIFVGTIAMNLALYLGGRLAGPKALHGKLFRKLRDNGTLDTLHKHVDKQGWVAVAIARFVPGTRLPVFVLAGILGMEWHKFVLTLVVSTVLWMVAALGLFHVVVELAKNQPGFLGGLVLALVAWVFVRLRSKGRKRKAVAQGR